MEYEFACERLRDDIAQVLLEMGRPTLGVTALAAGATRDLADALHHAAGRPGDRRWNTALSSLDGFIQACGQSPRAAGSPSFGALLAFLDENAPSRVPGSEMSPSGWAA